MGNIFIKNPKIQESANVRCHSLEWYQTKLFNRFVFDIGYYIDIIISVLRNVCCFEMNTSCTCVIFQKERRVNDEIMILTCYIDIRELYDKHLCSARKRSFFNLFLNIVSFELDTFSPTIF